MSAVAACLNGSLSLSNPQNPSRRSHLISGTTSAAFSAGKLPISLSSATTPSLFRQHLRLDHPTSFLSFATADGINLISDENDKSGGEVIDNSGGDGGDNSGGGDRDGNGGDNGGGDGDDDAGERNRKEALMVLGELDRSVESLPKDLAAAIEAGRIPGSVVKKFFELAKNPLLAWLMQFGGFKERLLADDLFLAKIGMECGVGIFTKTLAEYERRREKFFEEIEIVCADVAMAIIADFMLVYLPAPTVSLRPALGVSAGAITKFFHSCPDNAFQTALSGTSYSLAQRFGAIARNGAKLFAVGTASSLVGTTITNACINAKKAVDKDSGAEVENVPVLSTSVAYGVYMAVSSNLRYQILSGVIEQRILEPLLHQQKLLLSAMCFAVRTGNTFLGSLLWVDYARLIKIQ